MEYKYFHLTLAHKAYKTLKATRAVDICCFLRPVGDCLNVHKPVKACVSLASSSGETYAS